MTVSAERQEGAHEASWVAHAYVALLVLASAAFVSGALVLALTVPYHDWDAFAFGALSRAIEHGRYELREFGAAVVHRPLFYVLQGWIWAVFGFSFASGRVLGLCFFALLVAAVAALGWNGRHRYPDVEGALAGLLILSIPAAATYAISGLSDVPAAAMVATTAAVALLPSTWRGRRGALAILAVLTALAKPSALLPLVGLIGAAVAVEAPGDRVAVRSGLRGRVHDTAGPLMAGLGVGLLLHALAARRLEVGPLDYLTAGTSGYWEQRAADERLDALLRLDVLGPSLRVPLAFSILYALVRLARLTHRRAVVTALAGALLWVVLGPLAADSGDRALDGAEAVFAGVGFGALAAGLAWVPGEAAPSRHRLAQLGLLGLPALGVWWYATPYADRLAATAWPGVCALVAAVLVPAILALARSAGVAALAPALVLAVCAWGGLASLDGLGADQWRELRSLGRDGIRDADRTLNVVLPAVQQSIEAVRPAMGESGRLSTTDPRFSWWFPDRVTLDYVTRCDQLEGYAAFVLLTSDESRAQLAQRGGEVDPAWWARCAAPRLRQLTDGANGFAAFAVER